MTTSLRYSILPAIVRALLIFSAVAQVPDKTKLARSDGQRQTAFAPEYQILNINNLTLWGRADRSASVSPKSYESGVFPRGTAPVLYTDNFVWGGKLFLDVIKTIPAPRQPIRVGGGTYGSGTAPGRVIGSGSSAVAASPNSPDVRYYRIRRDYASMTSNELRHDAAETNEIPPEQATQSQMDAILAQYEKDWNEWPVQYGAPYIERNGIAGYQAPPAFGLAFNVDSLISGKYDEPGVAGANPSAPADQVMWTVFNDLDPASTLSNTYSEPLGLELQLTTWAYKSSQALGNVIFRRLRMINKGGVDTSSTITPSKGSFWIDSMYVAQWSDGDLGSFSDDNYGCDSTRGIGYFYNGYNSDVRYHNFNLAPPTIGYDIVQGPRVTSPDDSAIFDMKKIFGWKSLPMTSFVPWKSGDPYSEPCTGSSPGYNCNTGQWWKVLRGFVPIGSFSTADFPYASGPFPSSKFPFSGDPILGRGWVDGLGTNYSFLPGDCRINISTGPFSLTPGDTQEVIVALVAGLGSDRLSSIAVMRMVDNIAQAMHNSLYAISSTPNVTAQVSYPSVSEASINIVADGESTQTFSVVANLKRQDGSSIANVQLFDDGIHGDGSAGDGVFANSVTIAREHSGIYVDTDIQDSFGNSMSVVRVIDFITTVGTLEVMDAIIVSDNLNNDGVVNTGENVRYAFTIQNATCDTISNLRISTTPDFETGKIAQVYSIEPNSSAYLRSDSVTYFSLAVPESYTDTLYRVKVLLFDSKYNRWQDTLVFRVFPLGVPLLYAVVNHPQGKADGDFEVRIVDPSAVSGHTYVIVGLDSVDPYGNKGISLKDSTDGRILFTNHLLPDTLGHNMPVTDGFKVLRGTILDPSKAGILNWSVPGGQLRWSWTNGNSLSLEGFGGAIGWEEPAHFFGYISNKTLKPTELKNTLFKLATTDAIGNVLGGDDPNFSFGYRYLRRASDSPSRPEFASFIKNALSGYAYQDYTKSVPFSAWDVESDPPRRLMVGFLENNVVNGTVDGKYWPPSSTSTFDNVAPMGPREWFFVFDVAYAEGPDSRLANDILTTSMPVMWFGTPTRNGNVPFQSGDQFMIHAAHLVSSNDRWIFNPGILAAVDNEVMPLHYELFQNYPNPFNPATRIQFSIPSATNVSLKIYNLLGQEIATIVNEKLNSGKHVYDWIGRTGKGVFASTGVYFYRLSAGGFVETKKMLLLR